MKKDTSKVDTMDMAVLEILLVWLTIGVVIGGWISVDTFRRKVEGARWVAAGIFLNVIGLALYLFMREKANTVMKTGFHTPPGYRYSEPTVPEVQPTQAVQTVVEPTAAPKPGPEERPNYSSWAPVIKEQVEGIPRCPKCGSAASSFDVFCSECGTRIK